MADTHFPCGHENKGCAQCYAADLRAENVRLRAFAQRVIDEEEMLLGDYRAKYGPSSGKVIGVVELATALLGGEKGKD